METGTVIPFNRPPPRAPGDAVGREDRANSILTQLAHLEELRDTGIEMARLLKHPALSGKHGVPESMKKIARSLMQLMLLERQTIGIRHAQVRGNGAAHYSTRSQ